ncbi:uncharacterized protein [Misgurnus anguillicaudatus]|uniref:uncharacterized protein n=1 Tax=Misgurnus anguillicaudatus TaxID=75329 RepID=UPI002434DF3D|nr:uncharacterized protein LOC129428241 [Misgurnus anguillicaudatus]
MEINKARLLTLALAISFYIICLSNFWQIVQFENETRLRRERNVLMHYRTQCQMLRLRRRRTLMCFVRPRSRNARSIWTFPRSSNWWLNICTTCTPEEWYKHFRMHRQTFDQLCDTLRPWLTRQNTTYRRAVPVEARVAICIWRLATNQDYRSIGQLFGVGLSTCCLITQEVVTAINVVMKPQYIKHPTAAEFRQIIQGYRDKWRFPQVVGAIDGSHIKITAPHENSADYYNRKGDYSIILQGVVDHNMKFWDINVGRPGKVHDARVFALSSLFQRGSEGTLLPSWTERFEGVDVPLLLLGDSAYPLLTWLMKPYPEGPGVTPQQLNFNHRLSQTRMTVERAFGHLKGRWRCLLKVNETHITFISRIVSACCVLHNYCVENNDEYIEQYCETAVEDREVHLPEHHGPMQQINIRNALCRYFSTM